MRPLKKGINLLTTSNFRKLVYYGYPKDMQKINVFNTDDKSFLKDHVNLKTRVMIKIEVILNCNIVLLKETNTTRTCYYYLNCNIPKYDFQKHLKKKS